MLGTSSSSAPVVLGWLASVVGLFLDSVVAVHSVVIFFSVVLVGVSVSRQMYPPPSVSIVAISLLVISTYVVHGPLCFVIYNRFCYYYF